MREQLALLAALHKEVARAELLNGGQPFPGQPLNEIRACILDLEAALIAYDEAVCEELVPQGYLIPKARREAALALFEAESAGCEALGRMTSLS